MPNPIPDACIDKLFVDARTQNAWTNEKVPEDTLRRLIDIVKMAPTSANCCPARFVFLTSEAAKERLKPHLAAGNVEKTMTAPVVAIVGYDMEFYEHLPKLFPHTDARSWFAGNDDAILETAVRNGTLQGGYLILAARALGLDCGPMSGFDNAGVDAEFFAGTPMKSNFLVNIGVGDPSVLFPRSPRFEFEEMAQIL